MASAWLRTDSSLHARGQRAELFDSRFEIFLLVGVAAGKMRAAWRSAASSAAVFVRSSAKEVSVRLTHATVKLGGFAFGLLDFKLDARAMRSSICRACS